MKQVSSHKGCLRHVFPALLLLTLIGLWPLLSHNPFASRRQQADWDHHLKVLTYNTHRMGGFAKPTHNEVIRYLQSSDADVICLQEVEVYKDTKYLTLSELLTAMAAWPYTYLDFKVYNRRRQFGNVVFSKYPLIHKQTIPYESRASISSRCDMVVDGDTLRLIVNHLESNRLEQSDLPIDSLLTASRSVWGNIRDKLGQAGAIRKQQACAVRTEMKSSPYPIITVGDFNSMPWSYTYLHLSRGMRDAWLETGFARPGWTYVRYGLGLRIDYILSSRDLLPVSASVPHPSGSDHYPVVATLVW